jgi:hypothetical protein
MIGLQIVEYGMYKGTIRTVIPPAGMLGYLVVSLSAFIFIKNIIFILYYSQIEKLRFSAWTLMGLSLIPSPDVLTQDLHWD